MKYLISVLSLALLISSCSKSDSRNCDYDPCALQADATEVTSLENSLTTNGVVATKHCSGFFYIIDLTGTGSAPTICSTVSVKYKGQLTTNGNVFDQATTPVSFALANLIEAWKKGMMLIKPGGKIRMWVPPSLAYGSQAIRDNNGNIVIPANTPLYFEIELVGIS